jgi:hypothetical protein
VICVPGNFSKGVLASKACTTLALWHECCTSGESSFCLLCDFKELGVAKRPHPTTPTRIVSQRPLSRIVRADPKEPRPCPAETVSSRSSRWPASVGSYGFRHSNLWRCGCSLLNLRCDCPIVLSSIMRPRTRTPGLVGHAVAPVLSEIAAPHRQDRTC